MVAILTEPRHNTVSLQSFVGISDHIMAIACQCPFCTTAYRLKDDFAHKRVTCKNPNCRKIFVVPDTKEPVLASVNVDELAAAAFSDEPVQAAVVEEMISITCAGCDHVWSVEASKAGKNVLCPECRKANRVPVKKAPEKADWRGGDNRPTLAKRDTGTDAGVWATGHAGSISQQTAQKIVKERADEVEPEEKRRILIKRVLIAVPVLAVLALGVSFLVKTRKASRMEASIADAVKEIKEGTKDARFHAIVYRASGEYKLRSDSKDDTKDSIIDLRNSRNALKTVPEGTDRNVLLGELAAQFARSLGTKEEVENEKRAKPEDLLKEIRQTNDLLSAADGDLLFDSWRTLASELVKKDQGTLLNQLLAQQYASGPGLEVVGQVCLELAKLKQNDLADEILKKAPAESASIQAAKQVLGKPSKGSGNSSFSRIANAEAFAMKGDVSSAKSTATAPGKPDEQARALVSAGSALVTDKPTEAADLLDTAARLLTAEARGQAPNWTVVRACRYLALVGKADVAEKLADTLTDDQAKAWAKLEIMRGRLKGQPNTPGDDSWMEKVGDPTKLAAAAKAREEMARHNNAINGDYQKVVESWPKGATHPFGLAGLILGRQDMTVK
jgi:hypothetical protein